MLDRGGVLPKKVFFPEVSALAGHILRGSISSRQKKVPLGARLESSSNQAQTGFDPVSGTRKRVVHEHAEHHKLQGIGLGGGNASQSGPEHFCSWPDAGRKQPVYVCPNSPNCRGPAGT